MALPAAPAIDAPARGRPSAAKLAERLERARLRNVLLKDENRGLLVEVGRLGVELVALARRAELAIMADRPDVAIAVAGRLESLGEACKRRGGAA